MYGEYWVEDRILSSNAPATRGTQAACLSQVSSVHARGRTSVLTSCTAFYKLLLVQIFKQFRGGSCIVVSRASTTCNIKTRDLTDLS